MSAPEPRPTTVSEMIAGADELRRQREALEAAVAKDAALLGVAKALIRAAGTAASVAGFPAGVPIAEVARVALEIAAKT